MINLKTSWCYTFLFVTLFASSQLCLLASTEQELVTVSDATTASEPLESSTQAGRANSIKDWNFLVYMAANNNLHSFAIRNFTQMQQVGSTPAINVLVQLDEPRKAEINRYYIAKDKAILTASLTPSAASVSGTRQSLYNFVQWAVQAFPARRHCIVLWNHGSGIKDPSMWGRILMSNRDELFYFNTQLGLLELDRGNSLQEVSPELITRKKMVAKLRQILRERGIAFNDAYEEYLTNDDLSDVLNAISQNLLGGRKIDIVAMDACHMAMVEIGTQIRSSVNYMVGSSEIEPGSGYNYVNVLQPFINRSLFPDEFAEHLVLAYEKEYKNINADFTQSAVNLGNFEALENGFSQIAQGINYLIDADPNFKNVIRYIRQTRQLTTTFHDQDYIDLVHFMQSLLEVTNNYLNSNSPSQNSIQALRALLSITQETLNITKQTIIQNTAGVNLSKASGLSFYFPTRGVHKSYYKTIFDQRTRWSSFLTRFAQ